MPPLSSYFAFLTHDVDFESYLQLPLKALWLLGLGQYDAKNGRKIGSYLYMTHTILILTTLSALTVFYFVLIDWSNGIFDPKVSYHLALATWLLQATLASMGIAYAARKGRFQTLIQIWNDHKVDGFITESERIWARKRIRIIFCYVVAMPTCFVIMSLSESAVGVATSATANEMTMPAWYRYGIKIGACIFIDLVHYLPQYLFFVVVIQVSSSWRSFNSKLREMAAPYDQILEFAVVKHKELSDVVRLVNAALGFYAFTMLFTNVIALLSNLYVFCIATTLGSLSTFAACVWAMANVIMVLILASATMIKEAGNEGPEILYERYREHCMLRKKTDPEYGVVINETTLVLEQMRAASVGVSPLGVFTISRQFLVASFSIMVSYYLALIQFVYQPSAGGVCNCTNVMM